LTLRISRQSGERLAKLAKATERTKAYLAGRAIDAYLETQEWQVQAIEEAVRAADSPTAKFLDHEQVVARFRPAARVPKNRLN
jgi:predicted transcriptional regulator